MMLAGLYEYGQPGDQERPRPGHLADELHDHRAGPRPPLHATRPGPAPLRRLAPSPPGRPRRPAGPAHSVGGVNPAALEDMAGAGAGGGGDHGQQLRRGDSDRCAGRGPFDGQLLGAGRSRSGLGGEDGPALVREFGEVVEEAEAGVADLVAADAELAPERLPRMVMGMGSTCPERGIHWEGIDDRAGALIQVEVVEVV